jgi:predicted lipoprotein with Yx(FWY)xxD motif
MTRLSSSWLKIAAISSFALLAACTHDHMQQSQASPTPENMSFMTMPTSAGNVLATPKGMTLYTYDKDVAGQSNCYGTCADYWPPFLAGPGAKTAAYLTLISRSDGSMQWADSGKPLYTFVQDEKPGDAKGNNFHDVWHVVK